jgi:hypothetical protein
MPASLRVTSHNQRGCGQTRTSMNNMAQREYENEQTPAAVCLSEK